MTIVPVMSTHSVLLKVSVSFYLGDNCVQNYHLGRYIVYRRIYGQKFSFMAMPQLSGKT